MLFSLPGTLSTLSDICRTSDNARPLLLERTLLCPFNLHAMDEKLGGDRSNEAHQLITRDDPDATVPLGRPVWGLQSPEEEKNVMR